MFASLSDLLTGTEQRNVSYGTEQVQTDLLMRSTEAPPRLHRGSTEAPSGGKRRKHKRSKTPAVGLLIGAGITWPHQASTEGVGGGVGRGVGIKQQQRKITMTIFTWIISWLGLRDLLVSNLNQEEQR